MISPSDLFLAAEITDEEVCRYLHSLGFRDPSAADANLQTMADDLAVRQALGAMAAALMESLSRAPDPDGALVGLERYLAVRTGKVTFLNYLWEDPLAMDLLVHVLGTSPFLGEILIRNPEYFHWLFREFDRGAYDPEHYQEEADMALQGKLGFPEKLDALKRLKRRDLLRIATRDLFGKETLQSTTQQLSDLADIITDRTLQIAAREVADQGAGGAFSVIAMGKLGGRELNYSSDIDLIYVTDGAAPEADHSPQPAKRGRAAQTDESRQRLARKLTRALMEYTSEGCLYRVDLRLRPLGKGGQIAYSLEQCRHYYETWGETFERFAMLKARFVAGDSGLGERFLAMIQPFVYRKYLDHAALEEIVRLKARADAESLRQGGGDDNVKMGRGGIREIELFTQVLQLLYGGDRPEIRESNTLSALEKLLHARLITDPVCEDLTRAYIFLRTVEHRLQIVQERQLHSLPADPAERAICARRMGFQSTAEFEAALQGHRDRVHGIYQSLLHEKRSGESRLSARECLRFLNGEIPEAELLPRLNNYGFGNPSGVLAGFLALDESPSLVQSRSATRNLLANLLSRLLPEMAHCAQPETVLNRLEQLAREVGAASSLFRSLLDNELLRQRLLRVLDSGELLSQRLIRYPELMDSLVIEASDETPFQAGNTEASRGSLAAPSFEPALRRIGAAAGTDRLDELRRFKLTEEFKILLRWLSGGPLEACQHELSLLAECCVQHVAQWHDPARGRTVTRKQDASRPPASDWVIFALGKLGSRELAAHSDLDVVFLYRGDSGDSERFMQYQAFVETVQNSLEQPTAHGFAYRMDTRLRPEGNKGALAIPVATLEPYLQSRAEIWERLAWTRARFLAGSQMLARQVGRTLQSFVYGPWDPAIPEFMHRTRCRMEAELSREAEGDRFNFKVGHGALADIDFLMQMIQIREGASREEFRTGGTQHWLSILAQARRPRPTRLLSQRDAEILHRSYRFLRTLELFARMESDSNVNWISTDPDLLVSLGRRMGMRPPEGRNLLNHYQKTTGPVRRIYGKVMERLILK